MAGYIGGRVAISSPQQIETKHTLTATASQTSIPNIGYTVGAVHVYQNGVRLVDGTDYTATNGSTVTLETGATEGDQIVIVSHGSFETGDVVSKASGGTFAAGITANGDITASGGTVLVAGDTSAGDDAAIGYTSAEGLILTGQGTTNDVTIKNDADADVIEIPTGTVNVTMAGTLGVTGVVTSAGLTIGSAAITEAELEILDGASVTTAELNLIDGGTARGTTAIADGDGVLINDAGTMRQTNVTTLATYMGTKIGGGMDFLASSGAISDGTASVIFTQFDASKYDYYIFNVLGVVPVTDNVRLFMQLSADGSNYDTTAGNYHVAGGDVIGLVLSATNVGGASGDTLEGINVKGNLYNVSNSAKRTVLNTFGGYLNTSNNYTTTSSGSNYEASTAAHTAVKILFSSGNIEAGEITMFGVVNS